MPHPSPAIYLPTELVVLIVSFAAADEPSRRQRTLHSCCLVSRQWYSAAISYLYERPQLNSGTAFRRFTETISPPIGARRSKINLGSLVHRLDLSGLVHHSSPSLTARLLGRIKDHLEVFIAPRVSFSTNSLPALSKCLNLRQLDLSLVGDPIAFPSLKKALHRLTRLVSLRLPQSTTLTTDRDSDSDSDSTAWPPHLHRLQLSGRFSPQTIPLFAWPPALTSLALKNTDCTVEHIASLLSSPHLSHSLTRLTISNANRFLTPDSINAIPAFLPNLVFLSVPGDLVEDPFFDIAGHASPPLALEVLQLGYPYLDACLNFSVPALVRALDAGLANLCAVGFSEEVFCTEDRIEDDEDIEQALQKRDAERGSQSRAEESWVGVYYF
ncbi:F-box domain protein [Aspergillus ambiguus]|uniref:F-box domain protein n=1 Tax=Aspergillus ambiguus TaxID=176160 RepID=UPI003CCD2C52